MFTKAKQVDKVHRRDNADCNIGLFGSGGVGKSALTLRFISDEFPYEYDPTIEDSYLRSITVDGKVVKLDILDTAGQEEYANLHYQWFRNVDVALIVFSFANKDSLTYTQVAVDKIRRIKGRLDVPIILVGTKIDLVNERRISDAELHDTAKRLNVPYLVASAKTNEGVDKAFVDAYKAYQFPFNFMFPFKTGDWVYAYSKKRKRNIAIIKSKSDQEMQVYYFERPFWFNSATIKARGDIEPVPHMEMLLRIFLDWRPFGLDIPETVIRHIVEFMPERDFVNLWVHSQKADETDI